MAEAKTTVTKASVSAFLAGIADERLRKDCKTVARIMKAATGKSGKMWGTSIVGFGSYHYVYASGREGDWPLTGFAPRKQNLTIYLTDGFQDYQKLLKKLGPHKTGKSCLYLKSLDGIDLAVLTEMITRSVKAPRQGA